MNEPQAFLNGKMIPATELNVPVYDAGFVQGTTVAEQLLTFGGKLFRLEEHLERLTHSLEIVGVDAGVSVEQLADAAEQLASHNHALLPGGHDLQLALFVTPGGYAAMASGKDTAPRVAMHTYPLPFDQWAAKFDEGERLSTVSIRQIPAECWPAELKCRSRMHYYLADREADAKQSGTRAVLQDIEGDVIETSTANLVAFSAAKGLVSPPQEKILPGISLAALCDVAASLDVPTSFGNLTPADLATADEVLMTSTSICVLPVVAIDGAAIGNGKPGPTFRRLLAAWSEQVGVDIAAQARQFA